MALIYVSTTCRQCGTILAGLVNTIPDGRVASEEGFKTKAKQEHAKLCKGKAKKAA